VAGTAVPGARLPQFPATPVSTQGAGVVVSGPAARVRFPPAARVRSKAEFEAVFTRGRRVALPALALHVLADDAPARLGLAVSRKVDPNACGRNRVKRVLRDAFRHHRGDLAPGAYVVVARPPAAAADNAALRHALEGLLRRAGALPPPAGAGTMPAPSPLP
jgi:ribonuclease P protein component